MPLVPYTYGTWQKIKHHKTHYSGCASDTKLCVINSVSHLVCNYCSFALFLNDFCLKNKLSLALVLQLPPIMCFRRIQYYWCKALFLLPHFKYVWAWQIPSVWFFQGFFVSSFQCKSTRSFWQMNRRPWKLNTGCVALRPRGTFPITGMLFV